MRWVNDTLPPRARARWLLMTVRLSQSSLTGTERTEVAVGTVERGVHVRAVRAGAPRSTVNVGSSLAAGRSAGGRRPWGPARSCPWRARRPSPRDAAGLRLGLALGVGRFSACGSARLRPASASASGLTSALASLRAGAAVASRPGGRRRWSPVAGSRPPTWGRRRGVLLEPLVHLLDQPLVGAELLGHARDWRSAGGWVA